MSRDGGFSGLNWLVIVVLIGALAGAGIWYWKHPGKKEADYKSTPVTVGDLIQTEYFFAVNGNVFGRADADAHLSTPYTEHGHGNVLPNLDGLTDPTREDKHSRLPFQ